MSFMQRQITEKMDWLEIDGEVGIEWVPLKDANLDAEAVVAMIDQDNFTQLHDFYSAGSAGIFTVEIVNGHGCRLSAPGYMDCTDWTVYPTAEECREYLEETYGDE